MTQGGMIAFGTWLVFMGAAPVLSRRVFQKPARRGQEISRRTMDWLRRYHLAASDEYYEALTRIMIPGLIVSGVGFIVAGVILF